MGAVSGPHCTCHPSEVERERGLLESTPADIVRVHTDDLAQTMVRLQVVGDGERAWAHVSQI